MLDEEMDDIIRNAAAKHFPAYNDKAWEKMEMQLDKHLPQKTDRRKFIFFLLFFLLLGGGTFFTAIHFAENNRSVSKAVAENKGDKQPVAENPTKEAAPVNGNMEDPAGKNATEQITANPANNTTNNTLRQDNNNNGIAENTGKNKRSGIAGKEKFKVGIIAAIPSDEPVNDEQWNMKNNVPAATNSVVINAIPENKENENITSLPADIKKEEIKAGEQKKEIVKAKTEIKEKDVAVTGNKPSVSPDKKKPKTSAGNNFGLTVSVGPDLSFVTLNKIGKATLAYGAGLSYDLAKRFTVRTGFYFSKKIYTATPDQYHVPGGGTNPNLTSVDANCKVYEIPVSLSYKFGQRKNHSWFGGIGISSFLMKTEKYDYYYKTASGQTYNYNTEISNENKHYFSVLTLSGGYQYQLSKQVSVQAEPYVKLPLAGIGLGKIKLNSSGILLTLTVKPFAKRK